MIPKISVVMGTYNRAHLLSRSLQTYYRSHMFDLKDLELIVIDDWSDDDTDACLKSWSDVLNIIAIRPPYKEPRTWRDSASIINVGLRAAKGDLIIATHPEVMVGLDTLRLMWEQRQDKAYICAKPYYLTQEQQAQIDNADWTHRGALAVRDLPGFYDQPDPPPGHVDYRHKVLDAAPDWQSWVFGGMTRSTWKWFGGMWESDAWGSVDLSFLSRRAALGIPNITLQEPTSMCIHQNHDDPATNTSLTPRDIHKAAANAGQWDRTNARLSNL